MAETDHKSLAAALAAFQQELPKVNRDNQAVIPGKEGKQGYKYLYANLADVSAAVLPLLGKHGLSFSAKPTLTADGRFVLEYALRHASGEEDRGQWPLQSGSNPQATGSAITYARRYALQAVTGVAPDEDDDDGAAAVNQQPSPADLAAQARAWLRQTCQENHWDMDLVAARFAAQHDGLTLRQCTDAEQISKFRMSLFSVSDSALRAKKPAAAADESEGQLPV